MHTAPRRLARLIIAVSASCLSGVTVAADEPSAEQSPAAPASTQAPGAPGDAQRKSLIAANVVFGKDERDGFWPLYRDYRREMDKLQDQRAKVVAQYAEIFRTMSDDQAKSMAEDLLQADEGVAKLKRDYTKKFRKVLPETKVTRVLVIDAKIDAVALIELMANVPVAAPTAPQSAP